MKYQFQYLGEVNNKKLFTIISDDERGLKQSGIDIEYHHYKISLDGVIKKVSYIDTDLTETNTTIGVSDKIKKPSPRSMVSLYDGYLLFKELKDKGTVLEKLGNIGDLKPMKIVIKDCINLM